MLVRVPWRSVVILLLLVATAVATSVLAPVAFLAAVAVALLLAHLHFAGFWRTMLAVSLAASVVRSSAFSEALPEAGWYVVQFGPLAAATLATATRPTRPLRRRDKAVVGALVLFTAVIVASSALGAAPNGSLLQAGLLAFVFTFLVVTYTRRWRDQPIVRGDLRTAFAVLVLLQLAGLFGAATSSWAYDPDYGRFVGLFSNANYAGIVSALGIAVGVYLMRETRTKPLVLAGTAVLAGAMLISGSRGALLALAAGALTLVLARASRRTAIQVGLGGGLAATIVLLSNPALTEPLDRFFERDAAADISSGRFALYGELFRQFEQKPIIGAGYRTTDMEGGLAPHNIYLSVLVEMGAVGAIAFAVLIIAIVAASRAGATSRPLAAAAVVVATMELTESSIFGFGGPTALIAWLIVLAFAASGTHLDAASRSLAHIARGNSNASERVSSARASKEASNLP